MGIDVGVSLPGYHIGINNIVRKFVNAHLIIDLYSVFDKAVDVVFARQNLKEVKRKSKLTLLQEEGLVFNHSYIQWYKEWRNDAAHHFGKLEGHMLNQASRDVKHQLVLWELVEDISVHSFSEKVNDDEFQYGATIAHLPVILNWIKYRRSDNGEVSGCTYREDVNLSYDDYLKKVS